MTNWNVWGGDKESSMWLKYKGNIALEYTRTSGIDVGFDWIDNTSPNGIEGLQASADNTLPFRGYVDTAHKLFLNTKKITYGYKKADIDMDYNQNGPQITTETGTDDNMGPKLGSSNAYNSSNTMTLSCSVESDVWRDEMPFTTYDEGVINGAFGTLSPAYTLTQKLYLLQEMAKRSGAQESPNDSGSIAGQASHFTNPITLTLNWGYNYWNWSNFWKYLDSLGYTYLQIRKQMQDKWMPMYKGTWNYSTNLTRDTLLNGSSTWNGRIPCGRVEAMYTNCVIDDVRIMEDADNPTRMSVEMKVLFDSNNNRWGAGTLPGDDYCLFNEGRGSACDDKWEAIGPVSVVETAPATYLGANSTDWSSGWTPV